MRLLTAFSLLLLLTAFASCKRDKLDDLMKNEKADTIFPKPYLPVYPGSWWKYADQNGDTVTHTAGAYERAHLSYGGNFTGNYFTGDKYVPTWNGIHYFGYVRGEAAAGYPDYHASVEELRETTNTSWIYGGHCTDERYDCYTINRVTMQNDTSLILGTDTFLHVLHVREFAIASGTSPGAYVNDFYYAKDVGLIAKDVVGTSGTTRTLSLLSYHINH